MAIISNLFGESPFGALEAHGEKVHECVRLLHGAFQALEQADQKRLREITEQVFALETEADKIRNHVHELLVAKVLMPLRKDELFNLLEQQDFMADRAEDIAAILTYRDMRLPDDLMGEVNRYLQRVLQNCELAASIMSRLDLLVEASFGGRDALTVSKLITELAEREDALKSVQIELTRKMLRAEDRLPPVEAVLWLQVIDHLAALSKLADRVGNAIRLTLRVQRSK